jgi:predicted esterase
MKKTCRSIYLNTSKKISTLIPFAQEIGRYDQFFLHCFLSTILVFALTNCSTIQVQDNREENSLLTPNTFRFKDGGQSLFYTFDIGTPSPQDPLFIFVSGSGCASLKYRFPGYFNPIRNLINARVLALQKRKIEENSTGDTCSSDFADTDYFDQSVSDQREFINQQLATQTVKPRAVVLIGASEGATVAAKIASTEPMITHIALIGGGGETARKDLRLLSDRKWYFFGLEAKFVSIAKNPNSVEQRAWGQTYKYWSSLLDINIGDLLFSLKIPIIMAMGENDDSVPIDTAIALKKRFDQQGKQNFILLVFPNADHHLQNLSNSRSYAKEFLESIVYCIQATTGLDSPHANCTQPKVMQDLSAK